VTISASATGGDDAHRSHRASHVEPAGSVQLPDGDEVEQIEKPRQLRDREPGPLPRDDERRQRRERGAETPDRAGQADLRVRQRIGDMPVSTSTSAPTPG